MGARQGERPRAPQRDRRAQAEAVLQPADPEAEGGGHLPPGEHRDVRALDHAVVAHTTVEIARLPDTGLLGVGRVAAARIDQEATPGGQEVGPLQRAVVREGGRPALSGGQGRLVDHVFERVLEPDRVTQADLPIQARGSPDAPAVGKSDGRGLVLVEGDGVGPPVDAKRGARAQAPGHAQPCGRGARGRHRQQDTLVGQHGGRRGGPEGVAAVGPPRGAERRAVGAVQAGGEVVAAEVLLLRVGGPVPRRPELELAPGAPERAGQVRPRDDADAARAVGHQELDVAVVAEAHAETVVPGPGRAGTAPSESRPAAGGVPGLAGSAAGGRSGGSTGIGWVWASATVETRSKPRPAAAIRPAALAATPPTAELETMMAGS